MTLKVLSILLVSSPYDAFIMEEDGSIATRVIREYQGLNLSGAPRVTRVSSGTEASEQIKNERFHLVITMPFMSGTNAFDLGLAVKAIKSNLPVILIVHTVRAEPSQGTHFFQNITSLGIPYLTMNEKDRQPAVSGQEEGSYLDWQWLLAKPYETDGKYVRHLRLPRPFVMICNGKKSEGIIYVQDRATENVFPFPSA